MLILDVDLIIYLPAVVRGLIMAVGHADDGRGVRVVVAGFYGDEVIGVGLQEVGACHLAESQVERVGSCVGVDAAFGEVAALPVGGGNGVVVDGVGG